MQQSTATAYSASSDSDSLTRQTPEETLALLKRENPLFQLRSKTDGLASSEQLFRDKGGTETGEFARASAALPADSLETVSRLLRPDYTTLEIGGGHSTVVFGAAVAKHYCINPDRTANKMVREFLEQHELWRDNVEFLGESSDIALPPLEPGAPLDLALMDGNHSFPFPMLDFHFIDRHLRVGSVLVIDNVEINTVRMLAEFLSLEPAYRLVSKVRDSPHYDCYVYEKVRDQIVGGWGDQGINQGRMEDLKLDIKVSRMLQPLRRLKRKLLGQS
jgi:predicted O-methyltransferase YrrM